jgi:hypothetical protein
VDQQAERAVNFIGWFVPDPGNEIEVTHDALN